MSKPLAFGLNLKKPGASKPGASKPATAAALRRKPMFGGDDSDSDFNDDGQDASSRPQAISGDLDDADFSATTAAKSQAETGPTPPRKKTKPGPADSAPPPPKLAAKKAAAAAAEQPVATFGDLSSSLTSRKNAEAAAKMDASVYEYDAIYDSLKPKKRTTAAAAAEAAERDAAFMDNVFRAADVRKRDLLLVEERKIAREREAEGAEFADREQFVTSRYKEQQEENRRFEEEVRKREEEAAKRNKLGGMSGFFRQMLDEEDQRHAKLVKAAEEMAKKLKAGKDGDRADGGDGEDEHEREEEDDETALAAKAKALNEKGASVDVNEDGQVVDKRQLLRGGLNLDLKKKSAQQRRQQQQQQQAREVAGRDGGGGTYAAEQGRRRQAMRERQSRMVEEQLEQSKKRAFEEEEMQKREIELTSKSQKTGDEILSVKDRYLARRRAAEEAKKANMET